MSAKKEVKYCSADNSGADESETVKSAGLRGETRSLFLYYDPYPGIDLQETGAHLQDLIQKSGYSINEIRKMLCLSCPQPIYRWMKGQVLPTVDHLYALSNILCVHMEELLIRKDAYRTELAYKEKSIRDIRLRGYWRYFDSTSF